MNRAVRARMGASRCIVGWVGNEVVGDILVNMEWVCGKDMDRWEIII